MESGIEIRYWDQVLKSHFTQKVARWMFLTTLGDNLKIDTAILYFQNAPNKCTIAEKPVSGEVYGVIVSMLAIRGNLFLTSGKYFGICSRLDSDT